MHYIGKATAFKVRFFILFFAILYSKVVFSSKIMFAVPPTIAIDTNFIFDKLLFLNAIFPVK